ncbi:MAG: L,D-transpeptidase [Gemmatimonadota bacterium]
MMGFALGGAPALSLFPVPELVAQDAGELPLVEGAAPAPSDLYLRINLPAFELDVIEDQERVRTYPVSLGQLGYETHPGRYESGRVEWNPWWYPPASPWARGRSVTAPGPNNPMGRARIHLLDALYIHGSGEPMGDLLSHACIRLTNEHVLELARIVARHRLPDLPLEEIQRYEARAGDTQVHRLSEPLTVRVAYELLEERDGWLRALPDVYERGDAGALPWLRRLHPQVELSDGEVAAWMELATQEGRPVSLEEFQASGGR